MSAKDKEKEQDQEKPSDSGAGLTSVESWVGEQYSAKGKIAHKQSVRSGQNYLAIYSTSVVLSYGLGAAQESMDFTGMLQWILKVKQPEAICQLFPRRDI